MKLSLKQRMALTVRNERGMTLVEVLAVLVLTVLVTGLLTYVLSFANTSLQQVSARESMLQESRDIVQHITSSVRQSGFIPSGLVPADTAPRLMPPSQILHLRNSATGESIEYRFNQTAGSLTVERKNSSNTTTFLHTFSDNIQNMSFRAEQKHLSGPFRYTVYLEINLPNNQTRETMTTILSSDR